MVVCPNPNQWKDIYLELEKVWINSGSKGNPPPKPLILAGWSYSTDIEKKERWKETVQWAIKNNLESLIRKLEIEDFYSVDQLDDSEINPT